MRWTNYRQRKQPNAHLKWKVNFCIIFWEMVKKGQNNSKITHFLFFFLRFLFSLLQLSFKHDHFVSYFIWARKNQRKVPKNNQKSRSYKNFNIKKLSKISFKKFLETFCEFRKSSKILKWPLYGGGLGFLIQLIVLWPCWNIDFAPFIVFCILYLITRDSSIMIHLTGIPETGANFIGWKVDQNLFIVRGHILSEKSWSQVDQNQFLITSTYPERNSLQPLPCYFLRKLTDIIFSVNLSLTFSFQIIEVQLTVSGTNEDGRT